MAYPKLNSNDFSFELPADMDFEKIVSGEDHEDTQKIEAFFDQRLEFPENNEEEDDIYNSFEDLYGYNMEKPNGLRRSISMSGLPTDNKKQFNNQSSKNLASSTNNLNKKKSKSSSRKQWIGNSRESVVSTSSYKTMAEEVRNFHSKTPDRFRSKPKGYQSDKKKAISGKLKVTIPQSPVFSKIRKRPVTELPYEEREKLEFEEAQKNRLRAKPVNKKVLEGQPLKAIPKKKPTEIQPFNLTEKPKTVPVQEAPKDEFHARQVPPTLYKPALLPTKVLQQITKAQTPTFVRRYADKKGTQGTPEKRDKGKENKPCNQLKPTHFEPFSFDTRDKVLKQKREEKLKKELEEKYKKVEFQARPLPKLYTKLSRGNSLESVRSSRSTKSDEQKPTTEFKARPATVLHKEPFVPKKAERSNIEFEEFNLATTHRAKEREEFQKLLQEKEEQNEYLRRQREEMERMKEQEEIELLRKQLEYVAKPIRQYKEAPRIEPKPITNPQTPRLSTAIRAQKRQNSSNEKF